jgi:hypothetical protein
MSLEESGFLMREESIGGRGLYEGRVWRREDLNEG